MSDWHKAELHADRALEMYERGRWAEAEAELRKALALNPDHAEWIYNLGLTLEAAGREQEALRAYERAAELMPTEVEPLLAVGMMAMRLDDPESALEWFERVLKIDPTNDTAYASQIEALSDLGRLEDAETVFYLAQNALEEPSAQVFSATADMLLEMGDYPRCTWCLREALRLDPTLPRARARLGNILAATGRPQRAIQMFLRELRDDPGNIETLLDFGDLLVRLGRGLEAAEKFRRVLELEPANLDAHFRLGGIAMDAQHYDQAYTEYELVLKLDPEYPGIRLALAEAYLRASRLHDARQQLRAEIELVRKDIPDTTPVSVEALYESQADVRPTPLYDLLRLGDLLLEASMPAEAGDVFAAVVEYFQSNGINVDCDESTGVRSHTTDDSDAGVGRTDSGDDEGESVSDRSVLVAALRKLALARFESGDLEGGMAISRRILRYDSGCITAMHNLALSALQQGRCRVAAGWIQRGLAIDRHDDGLRRLRILLWLTRIRQWLTFRRG